MEEAQEAEVLETQEVATTVLMSEETLASAGPTGQARDQLEDQGVLAAREARGALAALEAREEQAAMAGMGSPTRTTRSKDRW